MILMLAPAPDMVFGAMPSGASYVADDYRLVKIANNSAADQVALEAVGCYTLSPVKQAVDLATFGPIGTSNDQTTWAAADAAIAAASGLGGLFIKVPAGAYSLNQVPPLRNRGGYFCDVGAVVLTQIVANPASPVPFVSLHDAYVTGAVFDGFILRGGWTYGRAGYSGTGGDQTPEQDPWLFQYPNSISDPSHPDTGAQLGQCAVYLHWADSGVSDATYEAGSVIGSQLPRGRIANLLIEGFGGDALNISGAGANVIDNIAGQACGGRGFTCNGYDSAVSLIDMGGMGLEGINLGPNGSDMNLQAYKSWFAGQRNVAGHQAGVRLDRCAGVKLFGEVQDPNGQCFVINAAKRCAIVGAAGWQNNACPLHDNAVLDITGAMTTCDVMLQVAVAGAPNVLRLYRSVQAAGAGPSRNTFVINHSGLPGDLGAANAVWTPFYWVDTAGDLDNNVVISNSQLRQPRQHVADSSGRDFFGLLMGNASVGLSVSGPDSAYPGGVQLIAQGGAGGALQVYVDASAAAAQPLVCSGNFVNNDAFVLDGVTYVAQSALTDNPDTLHVHFKIGATLALSLANAANAVNGGVNPVHGTTYGAVEGVRGTDYAWQTFPHPSMMAASNGTTTLTFTALNPGTAGNALTTTETCANASMSGATLTGGSDDAGKGWAPVLAYNVSGHTPTLSFGGTIGGGATSPLSLPAASANQALPTLATTQTAGATYTATEQAMLNAIKTDLGALLTLVGSLRTFLINIGLIKGSA